MIVILTTGEKYEVQGPIAFRWSVSRKTTVLDFMDAQGNKRVFEPSEIQWIDRR